MDESSYTREREIERIEKAIMDAGLPKQTTEGTDGTPDGGAARATNVPAGRTASQTGKEPAVLYTPPPPLSPSERSSGYGISPLSATAARYRVCDLERQARDPADFYTPMATTLIASQAMKVTDAEGPISHTLLARRVINAWGMVKVGNRIDDRIVQICRRMNLTHTTHMGRTWYWPLTASPDSYKAFRVPDGDNDTRRDSEDIPPEEIANAMREILRRLISLPEADLIREAARLFGFQRTGSAIDECFRYAVRLVVKSGDAKIDDAGRVVWLLKGL